MKDAGSSLPFAQRFDEARDLGLLALRLGAGALIWNYHMRPKLAHFDLELAHFPDPMGVGHAASFILALLSEGACSIFVAVGLLTRLASLPIVFTMVVVLFLAAGGLEGADVQAALLYALPYTVIILTGPGRWSLDHRLAPWYAARWNRFRATPSGPADAP